MDLKNGRLEWTSSVYVNRGPFPGQMTGCTAKSSSPSGRKKKMAVGHLGLARRAIHLLNQFPFRTSPVEYTSSRIMPLL